MISVILAMRDSTQAIDAQLKALARQTYRGCWELVVVDNGSTEKSCAIAATWQARIPNMRLINGPSHPLGPGAAKNLGARHARGDTLVFCDHDDVVRDGWLEAMAETMMSADLAGGGVEYGTLNPPGSAPVDGGTLVGLPVALSFMPFTIGANMAVSRRAFDHVGGFREERPWGGVDVDLAWRLQLAGYRINFVPHAIIDKRARHRTIDLWRQHANWGRCCVDLYRRYQHAGMRRRSMIRVAASYARLIVWLPRCLTANGRRRWVRDAAVRWGCLVESGRSRTLYL
ncbi:MAG: glycosyltransferase [Chloroflexi bacterium]|nr:MAG: glycosyltransferase [Chloroflexota bacterium]